MDSAFRVAFFFVAIFKRFRVLRQKNVNRPDLSQDFQPRTKPYNDKPELDERSYFRDHIFVHSDHLDHNDGQLEFE
jgi:hypothetical protein